MTTFRYLPSLSHVWILKPFVKFTAIKTMHLLVALPAETLFQYLCKMYRLSNLLTVYLFGNSHSSLENCFKPVYILLSIFGLFPYTIKWDNTKSCYLISTKSFYLNVLYVLFMVLVVAILFVLHIQNVFGSSDYNLTETILTQLNYFVELLNLQFTFFACYIFAYINRKRYVEMLNTVIATWRNLTYWVENKTEDGFTNLRVDVYIKVVFGFIFISIAHLAVNSGRNEDSWKIILVSATFVFPQLAQFVYIAHIYTMIKLVNILLYRINYNLKVNLRRVNESNFQDQVKMLKNMEMAYAKAFDLSRKINSTFETPMLMTIMACFHSMVSEAHIVYHGTVVDRSLTVYNIINCSSWLLWQALKIGQTLHKMPYKQSDVSFLMEIQHFSTQISFQSMEISVLGYFPLDRTLMYNIVAAATMYLIILVQFDRRE